MNTKIIYPAQRNELPAELQWGDRITVTILQTLGHGVYFEYKNMLGFIDNIRLTPDEYKMFQSGVIKPGDKYEVRIGIIEDINHIFPNNGTMLLVARDDEDEINHEISCMSKFLNEFDVGDVFWGRISSYSNLGISIHRGKTMLDIPKTDPRIVAYFTDGESQYAVAQNIKHTNLEIPVKIIEFDNQVLRVIVEILWDSIKLKL